MVNARCQGREFQLKETVRNSFAEFEGLQFHAPSSAPFAGGIPSVLRSRLGQPNIFPCLDKLLNFTPADQTAVLPMSFMLAYAISVSRIHPDRRTHPVGIRERQHVTRESPKVLHAIEGGPFPGNHLDERSTPEREDPPVPNVAPRKVCLGKNPSFVDDLPGAVCSARRPPARQHPRRCAIIHTDISNRQAPLSGAIWSRSAQYQLRLLPYFFSFECHQLHTARFFVEVLDAHQPRFVRHQIPGWIRCS